MYSSAREKRNRPYMQPHGWMLVPVIDGYQADGASNPDREKAKKILPIFFRDGSLRET